MNIAVVTASGIGSRMNSEIPKQFLTVNDKPIVVYTLEALQNNPSIDAIIVACLPGWEKLLNSHIKFHKLSKVKWVIEGGKTGQESITNCLDKLRSHVKSDDIIIVHDGNRPLLEDFVINESIRVCKEFGGAVAAIPTTEAILKIESGEDIQTATSKISIDRDSVVRTQTPHTFKFGDLDQAYKDIQSINDSAVAPCTVMIELGKEVHLSPGSELNFKITTQEDLTIFRALLNYGYDKYGK